MFDTASLTNKVGPLPVYAYIGIGVAGIYGYTKWSQRGESAAPTDPGAVSFGDTSSAAGGAYGTADGTPGNTSTSQGSSPSDTSSSATSNEEWSRVVSDWLISHGRSPVDVSNALSNYLDGKPLTTIQRAIISIALATFGTPPSGPIPIVEVPKPGPPKAPAPKPAAPVYTTVKNNQSTLAKVAANHGISVATLKRLNPRLKAPVKAGTRIRIK